MQGILLAELLTGRNPFHHIQFEFSFEFMNLFKTGEITLDLPQPPAFAESLCDLVKRCTLSDYRARPTFDEIVNVLKKHKEDFDPLLLEL